MIVIHACIVIIIHMYTCTTYKLCMILKLYPTYAVETNI